MIELNDDNGASIQTREVASRLLREFSAPLFGCEMGIAFGGGVEKIGELWRERGCVWGFDTFEGHPKQLGKEGDEHAVRCMDPQYERYGLNFTYADIRHTLDEKNLHNVSLVKGLINAHTDISFIPHLHYVLLDMDFPVSMRDGYALVADKVVAGGYLCLHDVVPQGHINGLYEFYQEIKATGLWDVYSEDHRTLLAILRKK